MLNLIHTDVLNYILHTYLYYSSDLKNLNILFDIKFPLKTHLHKIAVEEDEYYGEDFEEFSEVKSYDSDIWEIDVYENHTGAIRTFIDRKMIGYSYDHALAYSDYKVQCLYNNGYDKTKLIWYKNGRLKSYETYIIECEEQFVSNLRLCWHINGNLYTAEELHYGDLDGPSVCFSDDQILDYIYNYMDNRRHDWCRLWYPNGRLRFKGKYDQRKEIGIHTYWEEDGSLEKIETYNNNGNLERIEEYDMEEDGNFLKMITIYSKDVTEIYDGNLQRKERYKNEKLESIKIYDGKDGNLEKTEIYKDGFLTRIEIYKDGILIRTEEYNKF